MKYGMASNQNREFHSTRPYNEVCFCRARAFAWCPTSTELYFRAHDTSRNRTIDSSLSFITRNVGGSESVAIAVSADCILSSKYYFLSFAGATNA
jgi:hypothetical protein